MAETPEVKPEQIQGELEDTRHALADKLAQLGDKVTGTVETVENTVENVKEAAGDTVEAVKSAFDLPKHVEEHPWLVFGGAMLVGFLGGRLIEGARSRPYGGTYGQSRRDGYGSTAESTQPQYTSAAEPSSQPGILSSITQRFGSELSTLKGLAIGTMFGVVRDMVTRSLPESLKGEVSEVINNMTQHAGGKPIQGSLNDAPQQDEGQDQQDGSPEETGSQDQTPAQGQPSARQTSQKGQSSQRSRGRQQKSLGAVES